MIFLANNGQEYCQGIAVFCYFETIPIAEEKWS